MGGRVHVADTVGIVIEQVFYILYDINLIQFSCN